MGTEKGHYSGDSERAQIGTAATAVLPSAVQSRAGIGILGGQGRLCFDIASQGGEESGLVATYFIMFVVKAARLNAGVAGPQHTAAALCTIAYAQFHAGAADRDNVAKELTTLLLGKCKEGLFLCVVGPLIDDQDRFTSARLRRAERITGGQDGDDAKPIERDLVPLAFVDFPGHDGVLAAEVDVSVGEARTGPHIDGPGFDVLASQTGSGQR